jgi:hypothetical protein
MNNVLLEWKEPPTPTRSSNTNAYNENLLKAQALKMNPGKWALINKAKRNGSGGRSCGTPTAISGPEFERAYRSEWVDGVRWSTLYARYIG